MAKTSSSKTDLTDGDRYVLERMVLEKLMYGDEPDYGEITQFVEFAPGQRPCRRRVYGPARQRAIAELTWQLKGRLERGISRIR